MLLKAQPSEVYFWLSLATPHLLGNTKRISTDLRDKAGARLMPSERTEINRRVAAWKPTSEEQ